MGWILNRAGFKASPIVLGLVLGQIAEQGFVQAYIIGNAQDNILANYFARPISIILVIFILMGLFLPALKKSIIGEKMLRQIKDKISFVSGIFFVILSFILFYEASTLSPFGAVFPFAMTTILIILSNNSYYKIF